MPDSILEAGKIRPVFKPPFDIIHRIAADARALEPTLAAQSLNADTASANAANTAKMTSSGWSVLLPGVDSNFSV